MTTLLLNAITKDYLGFDEELGYIYSFQTSFNVYHVVAIKGNNVTPLITHTVKTQEGK